MRKVRSAYAAVLIASLSSIAAMADGLEDRCVLSAVANLPAMVTVRAVTSADATAETLRRAKRTPTGRWVQIDLSIVVGDRKIDQSYICTKTDIGAYPAILLD